MYLDRVGQSVVFSLRVFVFSEHSQLQQEAKLCTTKGIVDFVKTTLSRVGATLRFWPKNKVGRLLFFQLKLVQNGKKNCVRATKKNTRTPLVCCKKGQKLSKLRLVELPRTFNTSASLVCALKFSYHL